MNDTILSFCRAYMRACSTMSIRPSQMVLLEILCTTPGPHTPVMLADCMGVSRPMVAAHLVALQDAGYITRMSSPDDGRSVYILPTKSGAKLYAEYVAANNRVLDKLSQKMGVKKFESFVKLMSVANKIISE